MLLILNIENRTGLPIAFKQTLLHSIDMYLQGKPHDLIGI